MKLPKAFITILIPLVMLVGALMSFLGCNIIVRSITFDCRIIQPVALIGSLIALVTGIIMVKNLYKLESLSFNRRIVYFYIIAIIIPLSLLLLYSGTRSQDAKMKYFEGVTLEACASGSPSVPWGHFRGEDECYYYFGKCEELNDDARGCLNLHSKKYTEYESCDNFKLNNKTYCMLRVAMNKEDPNFCKSYPTPRQRWVCLTEVADPQRRLSNSSRLLKANSAEKLEWCRNLNATQKDHCILSVVMSGGFYDSSERATICNMMSNQYSWIKEDCNLSPSELNN